MLVRTPSADLYAAVPSLDRDDQPFTYAVEGDRIVGTWDIVKATTLYPTEVEHVDKDYRIIVELDEEKGTFDFTERSSETRAHADGGGVGGSKEVLIGKQSRKELSFSFGGVTKDEDGVSAAPLVYSFETSRIKEPLFTFLEQHGWERRKGLLGRLLGR